MMEVAQEDDLCFGGENASTLRQELQEMDIELHTPCSSPVKRQSRGKAGLYADSDSDSDSESEEDSDTAMRFADMSGIDQKEEEKLVEFITKSCDCKLGPQMQACSNQFTKEQIALCRNNCLEMSRAELDLVILTAIMCSRPPSGESGERAV